VFLRCSEVVEKFPHLRATICEKLISTLSEIKSGKVFRGVLWILGEYVESITDIQSTMREIRKVIGEIPILASEQRLLDAAGGGGDEEEEKEKEKPKEGGGSRPKVLADGTYATESAYTSTSTARLEAVKSAAKPPLRSKFPILKKLNASDSDSLLGSLDSWWRFLHRSGPRSCVDEACSSLR
jgi:coatomer subunit beta